MKARQTDGNIVTYPQLPSTWNGKKGHYINFRNVDKKTLESEGFYDVVQPSYNPQTQNIGGIEWDSKKKVFTRKITDIDFSKTYEVVDEEGKKTGEVKNVYDVDTKKADLIKDLKSKANKLLASTDWQVVRKAERDIAIDDDVKAERAKILAEYDKKKKEVNAKKKYETLLSYDTTFFPVKLD
jgi:sporulation protein YlmC with PRC-barrel domain